MGRIYDIETGTELHNVEPLPIQKKTTSTLTILKI